MVDMPLIAAIASGMPVMSALPGVGCVRAPIVVKAEAGAISLLTNGSHASTRARNSCRAATVWGGWLLVASMRSMHRPLQWFSFCTLKRDSHSSTTVSCCKSSSMACSLVAMASRLVGCDSVKG